MPFDFRAVTAPFRMQPGLRRLDDSGPTLTPNDLDARALAAKLAVLRDHPERALLAQPGFDDRAVVHTLSRQASLDAPDALRWDGARAWRAERLGWSVVDGRVIGDGPEPIGACLRSLPEAWRATALLALAFEEDVAAIDAATATIPWLAVCLPSHWAPEHKLGLHFAQVHAPVADGQMLRAAGAHLAALVCGTQRWERFVWSITPHAALCLHPLAVSGPGWHDPDSAQRTLAQAHWRTEHQTFLPTGAGQAVFTIHVDTCPLAQALTSAEQALQLRDALASMSPAVLAYRGLTAPRAVLLDWLAHWPAPPP